MPTFVFTGEISLGRGKHTFEREVEAESEKHARDKLYSELGSEHSITRGKIEIEDVEEN
jgi:ribosomal protein L20A (L18A)